jgi:alpha-L-fucosidase
MARGRQPGLIIVDRTVTGKYENYRTPEQEIPDKPPAYIWETCMTMGNSWSYAPNDRYKSANKLIHLLVDIVSKGGNLLLNIGPNADGELPAEALKRLKEIGDWMKINAEAIYKTRPIAPYKEAKTCFTSLEDGTIFAIYLADEDEIRPPATIQLYSQAPGPGTKIRMLGIPEAVRWEKDGKGILIHVPEPALKNPPCRHAWVFRISKGTDK